MLYFIDSFSFYIKSWKCDSSFFSFFTIILAILDSFQFHINLGIIVLILFVLNKRTVEIMVLLKYAEEFVKNCQANTECLNS